MALRAFRSNPCLGGFGGESSAPLRVNSEATEKDCDAFAQITKELVDNAVDACSHITPPFSNDAKRVRVVIERVQCNNDDEQEYSEADHVLRVTVSDNGCGMDDIQRCVDAFRTTKAPSDFDNNDETDPENAPQQNQTAGRYGIGLTLALVHAQRLVPDSCASITSAASSASHFTRASYVVDTEGDSVRCVKRERLAKTFTDESGTAVSLLVPGGATARLAWPRLAEYFARFQLSLQLRCSLEVMAPSLSSLPLFVRPQRGKTAATMLDDETTAANSRNGSAVPSESQKDSPGDDHADWTDGMEDDPFLGLGELMDMDEGASDESLADGPRTRIQAAVQSYLKRDVDLENIAHAEHRIGRASRHGRGACPTLEVSMIVHGGNGDSSEEEEEACESDNDDLLKSDQGHAKLTLVRMVNHVPLLDGAEASACGLVQGLSQKQSTWNSFGLCVTPTDEEPLYPSRPQTESRDNESDEDQESSMSPGRLFVPTYAVRDSDQVAPFFQSNNTHALFEMDDGEESSMPDEDEPREMDDGMKRKRHSSRQPLLPAHLRLGNILVIVQINAKPSSLPLPTLSKGRLPLNNHAINNALELGITDCLQSLQSTNSNLLLTAQQLKQTVRDARYIPSVAAVMATIICRSDNAEFQSSSLRSMHEWEAKEQNKSRKEFGQRPSNEMERLSQPLDSTDTQDWNPDRLNVGNLGAAIEERLRNICAGHFTEKKTKKPKSSRKRKMSRRDEESDESDAIESFLYAEIEPQPQASQDTSKESDAVMSIHAWSESPSSSQDDDAKQSSAESEDARFVSRDEEEEDDDEWW